MRLIEELQAKHAKANSIWRFYSDPAHQWRWERLAFDGKVVERSPESYGTYEGCLANACGCGYVSLPSLSTKAERVPPKLKRAYTRFPKR
jgi:hypothetical protein